MRACLLQGIQPRGGSDARADFAEYRGVNPGLAVANGCCRAHSHTRYLVVLHNALHTGHETSHNG
jgi:hypothetical protein